MPLLDAGIGEETVRVLAIAGARVIMTSRDIEAGQQVARQMMQGNLKVTKGSETIVCSICSKQALQACAKLARQVDILVFSAYLSLCVCTCASEPMSVSKARF